MLYHQASQKLILKQTCFARSFWQKFKGLMLQKKIDFALIFGLGRPTRAGASIHMMFMLQPIDVLFLNEKKQVVDLVENLRPWTLNYTPKKPANYIVELPAGTIKNKQLKLNDLLDWK